MKTIVAVVIGLPVLTSLAGRASAACTIKGWTDGQAGQPIWNCTQQ